MSGGGDASACCGDANTPSTSWTSATGQSRLRHVRTCRNLPQRRWRLALCLERFPPDPKAGPTSALASYTSSALSMNSWPRKLNTAAAPEATFVCVGGMSGVCRCRAAGTPHAPGSDTYSGSATSAAITQRNCKQQAAEFACWNRSIHPWGF